MGGMQGPNMMGQGQMGPMSMYGGMNSPMNPAMMGGRGFNQMMQPQGMGGPQSFTGYPGMNSFQSSLMSPFNNANQGQGLNPFQGPSFGMPGPMGGQGPIGPFGGM